MPLRLGGVVPSGGFAGPLQTNDQALKMIGIRDQKSIRYEDRMVYWHLHPHHTQLRTRLPPGRRARYAVTAAVVAAANGSTSRARTRRTRVETRPLARHIDPLCVCVFCLAEVEIRVCYAQSIAHSIHPRPLDQRLDRSPLLHAWAGRRRAGFDRWVAEDGPKGLNSTRAEARPRRQNLDQGLRYGLMARSIESIRSNPHPKGVRGRRSCFQKGLPLL